MRQGILHDIHSGTGFEGIEHGIIFNTDELLLFSIDVSNSAKSSRWLIGVENEVACSFIAPLSTSFAHQRKNMTLILPGIYSVGKLQSCKLVRNELCALQKLTTVTNDVLTFNKLYIKETTQLITEGNMTVQFALTWKKEKSNMEQSKNSFSHSAS